MSAMAERSETVSCRRCRTYCDWVVDPAGCVAAACPRLYAHTARDGTRWVGCLEGVLPGELAHTALLEATARGGFGPLRCARRPLPICRSAVQRTFADRIPEIGCVNPEFPERPGADPFTVVASGG